MAEHKDFDGIAMNCFGHRPRKAWWLLNHTPFDGCLLVFNANQGDFRSKAADFSKRYGFKFKVHAITGADRHHAHKASVKSDLYITLK